MSELQWFGDHGFLEANPEGVYNQAYFDKYVGYEKTVLGKRLNNARVHLVKYWAISTDIVDVGIGSGQFVSTMPNCKGYDINPVGVAWLKERNLWHDIYETPAESATFWDSLEHFRDPILAIMKVQKFVFVSMPVFQNKEHVLRSKHFRPDEHYWYFTVFGFMRFMEKLGFDCLAINDMESHIGREDIATFVFRRKK